MKYAWIARRFDDQQQICDRFTGLIGIGYLFFNREMMAEVIQGCTKIVLSKIDSQGFRSGRFLPIVYSRGCRFG